MQKRYGEIGFSVYIMGNNRPTLYTGTTNNLVRRLLEHKYCPKGFVRQYGLDILLYFEWVDTPLQGIVREKQIKNLLRREKLALIRARNPGLMDLSAEVFSLVEDVRDYPFFNERNETITLRQVFVDSS